MSESVPPEKARADEAPPDRDETGADVCKTCHGSGRQDGGECPDCRGTGRVEVAVGGG
jgi:hypothetical protein